MKYNPKQSTSSLLKKASHLLVRLASYYLKEKGIAHAYTPFLTHLWQEDGQIQAALHRKIGIEQPTAVRTLDRMERDQLITRIRSKTDRREIRIFLTPEAQQLQEDVISCRRLINSKALHNFSKQEKVQFQQLLIRVIENLQSTLENNL